MSRFVSQSDGNNDTASLLDAILTEQESDTPKVREHYTLQSDDEYISESSSSDECNTLNSADTVVAAPIQVLRSFPRMIRQTPESGLV
jgi:hypothetical protein